MKDFRVSFPKPCDEPWDKMSPRGCNRHCAACDKVIHNLSAMTIEEAEALLRVDPEPCVRARIGRDGLVETKKSRGARRMAVAVGSSLSLATAACQTADFPPRASIVGKLQDSAVDVRITARGKDGSKRSTKAKSDGSFELKGLHYGVYSLTITDLCGEKTKIERFIVRESMVDAGKIEWKDDCIIIGAMVANPESRG